MRDPELTKPIACRKCGAHDHITRSHDRIMLRALETSQETISRILYSVRDVLEASMDSLDVVIAKLRLQNPADLEKQFAERKTRGAMKLSDEERQRRREQGKKLAATRGRAAT